MLSTEGRNVHIDVECKSVSHLLSKHYIWKMAETEKGILQPKTFGFEWTIEGFFADCEKVGDHYKSPIFPIRYSDEDTEWFLRVYPKGHDKDSKDFVSLFLHFQSDDVSEVTVSYQLSIVSKQNNLHGQIKAKQFNEELDNWGFYKFVKQAVIKDTDTGALIDDTLTITCRMTFDPETKIFNGYNEWLDKMQKGFDEFESLIETSSFSDVTFNVQGTKICLHKDILMCRNSVFKAMFEHDMKENKESSVEITDVDYEVMKELFRFIYSGKVENIKKIAKNLLIAADKYDMIQLKALCEKTLYDDLTVNNAIEYLKLIESCDTLHLKKLVIQFVVDNLRDVVEKSDFNVLIADLDRDVVCEIMKAVAKQL